MDMDIDYTIQKNVDDNAKNRARAMFSEIAICEANKTPKNHDERYSMEKEYTFMNKYIFDGTHRENDEDDDNSFLLLLNN